MSFPWRVTNYLVFVLGYFSGFEQEGTAFLGFEENILSINKHEKLRMKDIHLPELEVTFDIFC